MNALLDNPPHLAPVAAAVEIRNLSLTLASQPVLTAINSQLPASGLTGLIGPSGAGKSSLLRCLNGLYSHWQGTVQINGIDVRSWPGGGDALRRHIGLIGQKPAVFPGSIYNNVVFGLRGWRQRRRAQALVEDCLRQAALWDEVKDRLRQSAEQLSLGQQQRLCLARALAVQPAMLLLDEPTASLDPRSKQAIEHALSELAAHQSLVWVSHEVEQIQRLCDQVVFLCDGQVIEQGPCRQVLVTPQRRETREFLRWQVCDCD